MDLLVAWRQVMVHRWVLELALEAAEIPDVLLWASSEKTRAGGVMHYDDHIAITILKLFVVLLNNYDRLLLEYSAQPHLTQVWTKTFQPFLGGN